MNYKVDLKLVVLWMLLLIQVLLVIFYFLMAPPSLEQSTSAPDTEKAHPVKFIIPSAGSGRDILQEPQYLTESDTIQLKDSNFDFFQSINGTLCFIPGTDIEYMKRVKMYDEVRCECKQGWHGKDCGQPEVVWRAFIASRQKTIPKIRKQPRRLIHAFSIINLEITLAEIKLRELFDVVDLFIICESNYTESGNAKPRHFLNRLKKGFLQDMQHKMLYIPIEIYNKEDGTYLQSMKKHMWLRGRKSISNLQDDDILVSVDTHEIPNTKALLFFKLYDGWPQPVGFRLRWSVYGFFWQHPKKTVIAPGAWTIQLLEDVYHNDLSRIPVSDDVVRFGLVIGDLNHYGGWFCAWCLHPQDMLYTLQNSITNPVEWNNLHKKIVDTDMIEELIGSGVWLDSTTSLIHKYQYGDSYYAPEYVLNNSWKFDFLLTNFYAKNDYN